MALVDTRVAEWDLYYNYVVEGVVAICAGLEYFLDHKILVQPKSVQICHAMGHKGGRIHLCMKVFLRL